MRKFGRPVDHGDSIRLCDVVCVPDNIVDPDAWLRIMYAPHVDEWVARDEWFIPVRDELVDENNVVSGHPVVNGEVLALPEPGQCVVEVAAEAGCLKAQAVMALEKAELPSAPNNEVLP